MENSPRKEKKMKEVKQMLKRIHRSEGGFTLVELLVTIAILAILFGIAAIGLGGLTVDATANLKVAELAVVQSAVDIYMADAASAGGVGTITARAVGAAAVIADADNVDFEGFLRRLPTSYSYWWTTDGLVTQP